MLPSRGIVRSLPSAGAQRQLLPRYVPTRSFGNGRQLSTLRRGIGNGLTSSSTVGVTARYLTAPIALGGVASARALSLWGYGKKSTTEGEAASISPESTTPPTDNVVPSQALDDAAAASTSTATTSSLKDTLSHATPPEPLTDASPTGAADLSSISDIVNNNAGEILSRAEGIGYLKSLGLDYGWGFTSTMQWCLEHVHAWTGLGWAGAIMTTAVLMRAVMFYPQIQATKFSVDMKRMQEDPRSAEVMAGIKKSMREGDRASQQQAQLLNNILRKEYNVPMSRMAWSFIPIPFSIGLFRIITGMTHIPVPALETAGFLWFHDLTIADPYMVLPFIATAIMIVTIEMNAKNSPAQQRNMLKKMKFVLAPVMFIGTSFLSSAVNLMGVALAIATLISQAALNNNAIRRSLGISPLIPPPPPAQPAIPAMGVYEAPRQAESVRDKLSNNLTEIKDGFRSTVDKMTGQVSGSAEEQAEKKRRQMIQKLEEKRAQQEREHFEQKYKGKK